MKTIFSFVLCCVLISNVSSYYITIDAHEEQCFFDRLTAKTMMSIMFEVASGGFNDIDVKIVNPNGREIHSGVRESSGKYTFSADVDGPYTYCFGNKMSSMTPKEVMFTVDITSQAEHHTAVDTEQDAESTRLAEMVDELRGVLKVIKNEQEYMEVRDRVHRFINENTNTRVVIWALFEAAVLIAMTFGQVLYLKRFFEVRTVV